MKKIILLFILVSSFIQAQFYEINFDVQPQINFTQKALEQLEIYFPDKKERDIYIEMSKNIPILNYSFSFNKEESKTIFIPKVQNSQESDINYLGIVPDIGENPIFRYKEKLFYNKTDFEGKSLLVYDSLYQVKFTDTGKIKNILGFESKESIGKHNNYDIVVWYTPNIDKSFSPDRFYGTNGLILEIHYKYIKNDIEVMISWNPTKIKPLKRIPSYTFNSKFKKISYSELLDLYEEMNKNQREELNKGIDKD
jgi:GLPGLI family protein